ncbi:unnamed protein product [Durusdinium trenchii]|uniref:Uncharacterized protein n=1 Tax=Durusdinium trenchii TaxID=1381693 RepID=A0ABP0J353_9DINO
MIFGVGDLLMKAVKAQINLWFAPRFQVHRIVGLIFLLQFFAAIFWYVWDYQHYLRTPLVWSLGLTGLLQAITASLTFTFMPKVADPGFIAMADKAPLSYRFIVENSFFAMLLSFQCFYMDNRIYGAIRACWPIELLFVFLPYYIRPLWPTTRIRHALENAKNKSDKNRFFMVASSWIVKFFYSFAKHYIGFFLNYIRFLGRVTPEDDVNDVSGRTNEPFFETHGARCNLVCVAVDYWKGECVSTCRGNHSLVMNWSQLSGATEVRMFSALGVGCKSSAKYKPRSKQTASCCQASRGLCSRLKAVLVHHQIL